MSKLLAANFNRLIKSKIFWFSNLFLAGYSIFVYVKALENAKDGLTDIIWNTYFFNDIMMIGFVMAVFTGAFLEPEYRDGIIRNKLAVGHTRGSIYFADFIICVLAGLTFLAVYAVVSALAGVLLIGEVALTSVNCMVPGIICSIFITIVYTAIYVAIVMADSNKARSAAVSLIVAMLLFIAGITIFNDLQQPEFTSRAVLTETGELQIEEGIPNSKYVSGMKRVIWETLAIMLPSGQSMQLIVPEGEFSGLMLITSVIVAGVICSLGMCLFKMKDIK
ncbi:MAG: ABC transporter permease [Lachnospiraceae bacterium]|nr:ABC transporter permease [Lachnospiraceae bacterium]